jgi:hypothetical protein
VETEDQLLAQVPQVGQVERADQVQAEILTWLDKAEMRLLQLTLVAVEVVPQALVVVAVQDYIIQLPVTLETAVVEVEEHVAALVILEAPVVLDLLEFGSSHNDYT